MLGPGCSIRHELFIIDGFTPLPDPIWPAKVRYSATGGNAGSSKDQDTVCCAQEISKYINVSTHAFYQTPRRRVEQQQKDFCFVANPIRRKVVYAAVGTYRRGDAPMGESDLGDWPDRSRSH